LYFSGKFLSPGSVRGKRRRDKFRSVFLSQSQENISRSVGVHESGTGFLAVTLFAPELTNQDKNLHENTIKCCFVAACCIAYFNLSRGRCQRSKWMHRERLARWQSVNCDTFNSGLDSPSDI
jgi:hypothetical protein